MVFKDGSEGPPQKHKKHKKHEHQPKEKKVKKDLAFAEEMDESLMAGPIQRKDDFSIPAGVNETSKHALKKLLDLLLHQLQNRDNASHFAQPVNAADAPGKPLIRLKFFRAATIFDRITTFRIIAPHINVLYV
jgi:hypothetical protein